MTRKTARADELVSATEIGEMIGVSRATVNSYYARERYRMPAPWVILGSGPIWLRSDIERWAASRRPRRSNGNG